MLENIFGIGIFWYYLFGLVLFLLGIAYVVQSGKRCWHSMKEHMTDGWHSQPEGTCRSSIKHLGIYWIFLVFYLFILFLISIYIILYGFQNGWNNVETHDLACAVGYIGLLILIALK